MRAPAFWRTRSLASTALLPAAWAYDAGRRMMRRRRPAARAAVPVICVGNLVAGGAGKTPVVLALAAALTRCGRRPHLLTRGYGGRIAGPVQVDPARHTFEDVGDEALLLAAAAPTWVARDRPAGASAAAAAGADLVLMDDGFQNPSLKKDLSLVVVDGGYGFGNGRLIPAGPLREPVREGLARADAVVLIGRDQNALDLCGLPMIGARLMPSEPAGWRGRRVVAFAGIGRPDRFFQTLRALGAELVEAIPFADHHPYRPADIEPIERRAAAAGAVPVTTEKDWVRLPTDRRGRIETLSVRLDWDMDAVTRLLDRVLAP